MNTQRKSKEKIRGSLGFFRSTLNLVSHFFMLYTQILIIVLVEGKISFFLIENVFTALYVTIIAVLITLLVLYWIYPKYQMNNKRYYTRPLTDTEYQSYQSRSLIHYTDYLSSQDYENYKQTGFINLTGNDSILSNYAMQPQDRNQKFIWFHLSRHDDLTEPLFDSFWNSHGAESTPRDYKVILPFNHFSKEQMMIRPDFQAIVIKGDYHGPAKVITTFPWYNQKVYWFRTLFFSLNESLCFIFFSIIKIKLQKQEKRSKSKLK
ncbi:hypothetical protein [Paenibacillus sp. FSL P4-0288]|uniref:hypothetical protein n=1 Tax=Paenibacillus sp. FSL P4-0288 TaxID=2921633 RepID=UPI0030F85EA3